MIKVIDISHYQPDVDYVKVKAAGIGGVILRCGLTYWGKQICAKDDSFERHYKGFKAAGVPVGAYYYSAADSTEVAEREAAFVIALLADKKFDLPIYYDVEEGNRMGKLSKSALTDICEVFCNKLEKAGYFVGVYANTNYFTIKLDHAALSQKYTLWIADYRGENANKTLKRDIWQYTSKGGVNGISGNVDMNECYRDFPSIIKAAGLNGYGKVTVAAKPENKPAKTAAESYTVKAGDSWWSIAASKLGDGNRYNELAAFNGKKATDTIYAGQILKIPCGKKTVAEIAREVVRGDWGNGAERKAKLEAAGYDYNAVQKEVNKLV